MNQVSVGVILKQNGPKINFKGTSRTIFFVNIRPISAQSVSKDAL